MILDAITASTRRRVEAAKLKTPFEQIKKAALQKSSADFPFERALALPGISFICEVKKASPSKGIIAPDFPYLQIAEEYEKAGAAAISVLTEPEYFQGSDEYLKEIAAHVSIPTLRKDFIIDTFQVYEAKTFGASAVLLIGALLDKKMLIEYINITSDLGISALVEAHTEDEVKQAVDAGARVIGINNRDLKTFQVDLTTTRRLKEFIPTGILVVAESGVQNPEDIRALGNVDAVLIGESMVRAGNKKEYLAGLQRMEYREN
jgi:indole-3-glycerol phosphate synthase